MSMTHLQIYSNAIKQAERANAHVDVLALIQKRKDEEAHRLEVLSVACGCVDFIGWQEALDGSRLALFNLKKPLGEHPIGSTLAGLTILKFFKKEVA